MTSLATVLRTLYGQPASVTIIDGKWKTGKTDFGLYLAQICQKMKLVVKIAGNVQIYKDKKYQDPDQTKFELINNFEKLKMWGFGSSFKKMYIFDEAIKNAKNRGAMSKLNKAWFEVIPELSKMRCHLLIITQSDEYVDSIFKNATFLSGTWKKKDLPDSDPLYRKVVTLKARRFFASELEFYPIEPTTLCFDPYQSATMALEPTTDQTDGLPLPLLIAFQFGEGATTTDLKTLYDMPSRQQAIREVRKGIRMAKKLYLVS